MSISEYRVLEIKPEELVKDNPASLIVNPAIYNQLRDNWHFERWVDPHIVMVETPLPGGQMEIRSQPLDGMNRTVFAAHHTKDVILPKKPDFVFMVRDVTISTIADESAVLPNERYNGQEALTWLQYLRALVPYTIVQQQIAPDRIAGHLINSWRRLVGPEVAAKYSATAALCYLNRVGSPPSYIKSDLAREGERVIFEGETKEQREHLTKGLLAMAEIINLSRLQAYGVMKAAFDLISINPKAIGGELLAKDQIYNMLSMRAVDEKLSTFRDDLQRERARAELAEAISQSLKNIPDQSQRENLIQIIPKVLNNDRLDIFRTTAVFLHPQPNEKYVEVQKEVSRERLLGGIS